MELECKCGFSCQKDPLFYLRDCNVEGYVEVVNSTVFCERIVYFGNKRLTSCPVLLQMFEEQKQREREKKIKKTIDAGKEESGSLDTSGT